MGGVRATCWGLPTWWTDAGQRQKVCQRKMSPLPRVCEYNFETRTNGWAQPVQHDERGVDGLFLLEVNTQPGMTPLSLVPEQGRHVGMDYDAVVQAIVDEALQWYKDQAG